MAPRSPSSSEQTSPDAELGKTPPAAGAEARGAASAPPDGGPARSPLPAARIRLLAEQVVVGPRLRPLNPAKVEALIVSYRETGALPPILTRPIDLDGDLPMVALVAGLHRLEACRQMGVHVDCMVRDMSDAQAQLTEIDENLLGPDLNALDRAVFVAARLPVWAAMNPDRVAPDQQPKRGRPKNSVKFTEFPAMGFADETAAEIGLSKSAVEKALQIARGLTPATRAALAGTWVAKNEGVLRQLAGVAEADEQIAVAGQLVSGRTKSVSDARAYAAGREPIKPAKTGVDETLKALEKLWKGAPRTHREAMLDWLAGQAMPAGWVVKGGAK